MNLPTEYDLIQMEQCADTAECFYGDSFEVEQLADYVRQFVALVRSLRA